MDKKVTFTNSEGHKLVGTVIIPDKYFSAVILVHGSKGNRNGGNSGILKYLAEKLAKEKILTFRFDCRGLGESEGEYEDIRLKQKGDDTASAIRFIKERYKPKKIGLIGWSSGGRSVLYVATELNIDCLVTWAADIHIRKAFESYGVPLDEFLEYKGRRRIGKDLEKQEKELTQIIKKIKCPYLIIQGEKDTRVDVRNAKDIYKLCKSSKLRIFEDVDHVAWAYDNRKERVIKATVNWFKKYLK